MAHKSIFNWSGGKDSALALYYLQQDARFRVERLLTSINSTHQRVSMHGVREELLTIQAMHLGLPLQKLLLPEHLDMEAYNQLMAETMLGFKNEGFTHSVFGDIFLEDLKKYRESQLASQGFQAYFPLWKKETTAIMEEFLALGFKTIVVCIKSDVLDQSFCGRIIDQDFLKDLPDEVDPCGERGEFHTFVYDGPIFREPVPFTLGEKVYREYPAPKSTEEDEKELPPMGFWFCDLLPFPTIENS